MCVAVVTALVWSDGAHRWFLCWTEAGLWAKIHRAVLDELGSHGLTDWSRTVADVAAVRAKKGDP